MAANDAGLIELAYASSFTLMADMCGRPWSEPVGDRSPGELENEAYRLSAALKLRQIENKIESLEAVDAHWRRQLRTARQKDLLTIGMLLVRQHAMVTLIQCHPDLEERPEICFALYRIREQLLALYAKYGIRKSIEKMPEVPLPGSSGAWKEWSGDELRESILEELRPPSG